MSTQLDAIHVQKYRGFAEKVELPIAKLVLVFGPNDTGKSALTRLPKLLASSAIGRAGEPLNLAAPVAAGATVHDIITRGLESTQRRAARFSLVWRDDRITEWEIGREERSLMVRKLRLVGPLGEIEFSRPPVPEEPYSVEGGNDSEVVKIEFMGLLPELDSESQDTIQNLGEPQILIELRRLRGRLRQLQQSTHWVPIERRSNQRAYSYSSMSPPMMNADSSNAPQILAAREDVRELVNEWYSEVFGKRLEVVHLYDSTFRLVATSDVSDVELDFVECGSGLERSLPVVTGVALASLTNTPSVVCVEEPESHLHPSAQMELADFVLEGLNRNESTSVVVETHSEVFLRAVQLGVAQGRISNEDVRILWVDRMHGSPFSSCLEASIDNDGQLSSGWPQEAFEQTYRQLAKLDEVQLFK